MIYIANESNDSNNPNSRPKWIRNIKEKSDIKKIFSENLKCIGLEIVFNENENGYALQLLAYHEDDINPNSSSNFLTDRYVIEKGVVQNYLDHIDESVNQSGNLSRGSKLDFYLKIDRREHYCVGMQIVDFNNQPHWCAEGNTPIELP
jgi:hypothetical protein